MYNSIRYIHDYFVGAPEIQEKDDQETQNTREVVECDEFQLEEAPEVEEVEEVKTLNLRRWDASCLKAHKGSTSLIIGKRALGKTTLAKHLADQLTQQETKVLAFSPVGSPSDYTFNAHTQFYEKYDSELLGDLIKQQRRAENESVIILDDAFYSAKMYSTDNNFLSVLMNGRHLKIHMIMSQQYVMGLSPQMRNNIDYIFIFSEPNESNKRRLYDHYAGMFPTYELFSRELDRVTKDYGCMVIHNNAMSDKLMDQVFWYKVPFTNLPRDQLQVPFLTP